MICKASDDFDYRRFDLDYPDSDAPNLCFQQSKDPNCLYKTAAYGHDDAPSRFAEFNREFKEMLAKDTTGAFPALMTLRFPNDHTSGMRKGAHSTALSGRRQRLRRRRIVETLSKSPIWKHTAIFVIEDDAQDGSDHVDMHRSTCYVISPYITKGIVDHTFHNTDSVLKTIEQLLGLPPMNQYDAVATPIEDFGKSPENSDTYGAILPAPSLIGEINAGNPKSASYPLTLRSAKMDFVHPDSAPAGELNEIVWKSVKGMNSKMPAPRAGLASANAKDEE